MIDWLIAACLPTYDQRIDSKWKKITLINEFLIKLRKSTQIKEIKQRNNITKKESIICKF